VTVIVDAARDVLGGARVLLRAAVVTTWWFDFTIVALEWFLAVAHVASKGGVRDTITTIQTRVRVTWVHRWQDLTAVSLKRCITITHVAAVVIVCYTVSTVLTRVGKARTGRIFTPISDVAIYACAAEPISSSLTDSIVETGV